MFWLWACQHDSACKSLHLSVNVAEVDAPQVELAHLIWIPNSFPIESPENVEIS